MITITKKEIDFLNTIWENQKVYHADNVPSIWHNVDNGLLFPNSNVHLRAQLMYGYHGFFMETLREINPKTLKYGNVAYGPDQPYFHRQRRYMIQQYIDNDGYYSGPIHVSVKPRNNYVRASLFDSDAKSIIRDFIIISHPGHTRLEAACYLQQPIKNALVAINKKYDYKKYLDSEFKRIFTPKKIIDYWQIPDHPKLWKDLGYSEDGIPIAPNILAKEKLNFDATFYYEHLQLPKGTKFHEKTECFALKLWELKPYHLGNKVTFIKDKFNMVKTNNYLHEVWESSKDISKIVMQKTLNIYTDSELDVKKHLIKQRNKLKDFVKRAKKDINKLVVNTDLKFDFDVVKVDKKPNNISELNDNKGFAIWMDKSIVLDFKREIYELLFFTRYDVKKSKTLDKRVEVINCRFNGTKEWIIPDEYFNHVEYDLEELSK